MDRHPTFDPLEPTVFETRNNYLYPLFQSECQIQALSNYQQVVAETDRSTNSEYKKSYFHF